MNSPVQAHLPLTGKHFFIDPKVEKTLELKVKQMLIELGGKVEDFLDKGIHFALTSEINYEKSRKGDSKQGLSPCCESPFNTTTQSSQAMDKNSLKGNNWKDLAKQARLRAPKNVNSIIDTAKSLGIKIRLISDVMPWLNKKTATAYRPSYNVSLPAEIKLKSPCLKVEDRNTKPIYEEFASFSHIDIASQGRECPIINVDSFARKTTGKKKNTRKGFCECCQCSYLNERKHRRTVEHISYGEKSSNFESLDGYLTKHHLTLDSVLRRHASPNTIQSTSMDFSRKPYVKIANMKSSLVENTKEEITKQNSPRRKKIFSSSPVTKQFTPPRRKSPRKHGKNFSPLPESNFAREQNNDFYDEKPKPPHPLLIRSCERAHTSLESPRLSSASKPSAYHASYATPPSISTNLRKRKRVQSCEISQAKDPANSPLSRLRSSKQKLLYSGLSHKVKMESSYKSNEDDNSATLSTDDILSLLESSSGRELFDEEFLGF